MASPLLFWPPPLSAARLRVFAARGRDLLLVRRVAVSSRVPILCEPKRVPILGGGDSVKHLASTIASTACFFSADDEQRPASSGDEQFAQVSEVKWRVLHRWDVPWSWSTITLTILACGLSVLLTGSLEASLLPYFGLEGREISLDQKAELLFAGQLSVTAVVLGVIFGITKSFEPLPNDLFRYNLTKPFDLRDGWLLWAGIGLLGALIAIALTGTTLSIFHGENPQREQTDALIRLLPLIGSSGVSTAFLVATTGILAPVLEETIFRGFLMVSLTKYLPTPVSVLITAAIFAIAHLTPGEFPQLFVLGTALGFSYAQTHNLLTPITIHALWNSGVILLLTFLQIQGYDIRELLQPS
ncbi:uncharacterized protein LOC122008409 isoform X1 [Zingiber officinale]|uniref:uncharacterized protein LOC122008409 isoform X1 n=1 Tax=Zingiber officinale TaxID=94328 RepID=UPI001C4AF560|nr:uncharacterized protein LOC122008409 isoform X1 [Zingiber officinale]